LCAEVRSGRTGASPTVVCAGKTSAAQPWRWHNADNMHMTTGQRQVHGKRGSAHDGGLCSHDSWSKKGKALARRWRAQRVGAGGKPELGDTRRYKGTARSQGKGARAMTMAAAPAKRPARLDGRLSGDGGSARRRGAGQRSKNGTENSELTRLGSASARRPGPQLGRGG
jgi:hypothetical protein